MEDGLGNRGGRSNGDLAKSHLEGVQVDPRRDAGIAPLNILIGANGAGKSNLVLFFKMLNEVMESRLQNFVATSGRAQSILHFGPKVTSRIEAILEFTPGTGVDYIYEMQLAHAVGDTLVFADETLRFRQTDDLRPLELLPLSQGRPETQLRVAADEGKAIARAVWYLLSSCRVFHFHDTSPTARVRQYCYVGDNRSLAPDAGNLAAVLHRLKSHDDGAAYSRIVKTIRTIAPFFDDFELAPSAENGRDIMLDWRHVASSQIFGPHDLSDGTLRAICLVTLLLQPEDELPGLIIVDEPELGLHPYALNVIASLINKASHHAQVLVSTQSSALLDNFQPEDVVVAGAMTKSHPRLRGSTAGS